MKKHWILAVSAALALAVTIAGMMQPEATKDEAIKGLWSRDMVDDGVRFYYFHGDGNGLYRYGRVAFTNTHSYDYTLKGAELKLTFRKTGEQRSMKVRVEGQGDQRVLVVENDPREAGKTVRYRYVPVEAVGVAKQGPAGRMWIDLAKYSTGGMGFSMYQLTPAGIDGRGTGWHHRGDFNNWSTEALTYRMRGNQMQLNFELSGEQYSTRFAMEQGDTRALVLDNDPRNWWQRSRFADMGKSFALGGRQAAARGLGGMLLESPLLQP